MASELLEHVSSMEFGTFQLGEQHYGLNILKMREIIRPLDITKIPRASSFMEGVINLRNEVIPIVSLRTRFGMPARPFDKETRIINIETDDIVVGFIVDSIGHVQRFGTDEIEPAPVITASAELEYITGLAKRENQLFIILDPDKLVSTETIKGFLQE